MCSIYIGTNEYLIDCIVFVSLVVEFAVLSPWPAVLLHVFNTTVHQVMYSKHYIMRVIITPILYEGDNNPNR